MRDSHVAAGRDPGAAGMSAQDMALILARAGGSRALVGEGQPDQTAFEVADVQAGRRGEPCDPREGGGLLLRAQETEVARAVGGTRIQRRPRAGPHAA